MKLRHPLLIAAIVALAVLGAATAGVVTHSGSKTKTTTINVTEKEYHLTLSSHKAVAGQVRFVIKNTGTDAHALAISGAGVKLKKTAAIKPGKSSVLLVNVRSGQYSIWCPMPGHAAKGMKATLTLPSALPDSAPPTTAPTEPGATTTSPPIPGY